MIEHLKEKYKDGFRCIHAENCNGLYTMHLKNFYTEKTETLETDDMLEVNEIQEYLNAMEQAKEDGYD